MSGKDLTETQRQAVENLLADVNVENLWLCILAFESYPFTTTSGLPFTYTFKLNRYGKPGNEIVVSRKEKSITRSSVEKALAVVIEKGEPFPVKLYTPKELNVFGVSYIYPLFIEFGLVDHIGSHQRGGPRKGYKRKHKKERGSSVDNNNGVDNTGGAVAYEKIRSVRKEDRLLPDRAGDGSPFRWALQKKPLPDTVEGVKLEDVPLVLMNVRTYKPGKDGKPELQTVDTYIGEDGGDFKFVGRHDCSAPDSAFSYVSHVHMIEWHMATHLEIFYNNSCMEGMLGLSSQRDKAEYKSAEFELK